MLTQARWHLCKSPSAKLSATPPLRRVRFVLGNGTPPSTHTRTDRPRVAQTTCVTGEQFGLSCAPHATSHSAAALHHTVDLSFTHPRHVDMFIQYVDFVGLGVETLPTPATEKIVQSIIRDSFWGTTSTVQSHASSNNNNSTHGYRLPTSSDTVNDDDDALPLDRRASSLPAAPSPPSSSASSPCVPATTHSFSPQPLLEVILLPNGGGPCLGCFISHCNVAEVTQSYAAAMRAVWQCRPASLLFMQHRHSENTLRRLGALSPIHSLILRRSKQVTTQDLHHIGARHVYRLCRSMCNRSNGRNNGSNDDDRAAVQLIQLSLASLSSHAPSNLGSSFAAVQRRQRRGARATDEQLDDGAADDEEDEGGDALVEATAVLATDTAERATADDDTTAGEVWLNRAWHLWLHMDKTPSHATPAPPVVGDDRVVDGCAPPKRGRWSARLAEATMRLLLRHASAPSCRGERTTSTSVEETCHTRDESHDRLTRTPAPPLAWADWRTVLQARLSTEKNESSWCEHALLHGFLQLMAEPCHLCRSSSRAASELMGGAKADGLYAGTLEHAYLRCAHALLFGEVSPAGCGAFEPAAATPPHHCGIISSSAWVTDLVAQARALLAFIWREEARSIATVQSIAALSSTLRSLAADSLSAIAAESERELHDGQGDFSATVTRTEHRSSAWSRMGGGSFPVLDDYMLSSLPRSTARESEVLSDAGDVRVTTPEQSQQQQPLLHPSHACNDNSLWTADMHSWMPGIGVDAGGYWTRLLRYTDALCAAVRCSCAGSAAPQSEVQEVLRDLQHALRTHLARRFDVAAPRLWRSPARWRAFPFLESLLLSLHGSAVDASSSSASSQQQQHQQRIWALYFVHERTCDGRESATKSCARMDYATFALAMLYPHFMPCPVWCGGVDSVCGTAEAATGSGEKNGCSSLSLVGQHAFLDAVRVSCVLTQAQYVHLCDLVEATCVAIPRPAWVDGRLGGTAHVRGAEEMDNAHDEGWRCVYATVNDAGVCTGLFASLDQLPWHALLR